MEDSIHPFCIFDFPTEVKEESRGHSICSSKPFPKRALTALLRMEEEEKRENELNYFLASL